MGTQQIARHLCSRMEEIGIWGGLLPKHCPHATACWGKWLENAPNWNGYYLPYIGREYVRTGTVFLGINMHEYGGGIDNRDALRELYEDEEVGAIHWIGRGAYRVTHKPGNCPSVTKTRTWRGSPLYDHIASLAAIIFRRDNGSTLDAAFTADEKASALRSITVTNLIKCSPALSLRSQPRPNMALNCPPLILATELQCLDPAPKRIVLLGTSYLWNLQDLLVPQGKPLEHPLRGRRVYAWRSKIADSSVAVLCLPWPKSWTRIRSFAKLLAEVEP